jgi:hypothetical protein
MRGAVDAPPASVADAEEAGARSAAPSPDAGAAGDADDDVTRAVSVGAS